MNEDLQTPGRRKVAKAIMIGGAAMIVKVPGRWAKPLVATVLVPAHAVASSWSSPLPTSGSASSYQQPI